MSGLRVTLITPEYPGCGPSFGVGTYVRTLAKALRGAGADPLVLVCTAAGRFTVHHDTVHRCGDAAHIGLLRPCINAAWLDHEITKHQSDIVEYPNWGGLGAWLKCPVPRVVRLSTPIALIPSQTWHSCVTKPIHQWWEQRSVRRAHMVIADSTAMAEVASAHYACSCTTIIPHAYDGSIVNVPSSGNGIIAVGRLEPRKGTDVLIKAWARIRDHHPSVRLHLVGSDTGFGAQHIARMGSERIIVHGRVTDEQLAAIRRTCCIEVLASRFESFGLVVLEAWASGLAVIATRAGSLPEVVETAGKLVPPEDHLALADALHQLLSDQTQRRSLAHSGINAVSQRFTSQRYAEETLAAYRQTMVNTHINHNHAAKQHGGQNVG